jgi:hypothetical protein
MSALALLWGIGGHQKRPDWRRPGRVLAPPIVFGFTLYSRRHRIVDLAQCLDRPEELPKTWHPRVDKWLGSL